ncbi:MAG: hypothetical protein AAF433_18160 [Bacteroidota bacterium]
MTKLVFVIFCTLLPMLCIGQEVVRQAGQSKDDLVSSTLDKYSLKVGETYEFKDSTSSAILYFEIQALDSLPVAQDSGIYLFSPFIGRPAATFFKLLFSTDGIHYQQYTVDTIAVNSGCCPCHFPTTGGAVLFPDENAINELVLLVTNPVKSDCNSVTTYVAIFYEGLEAAIASGEFSVQAARSKYYDPWRANVHQELIDYFREQ